MTARLFDDILNEWWGGMESRVDFKVDLLRHHHSVELLLELRSLLPGDSVLR